MFEKLNAVIETFAECNISEDRKKILEPVIQHIKESLIRDKTVRLNFICTHNSRRSHLAQVWAQTMAYYFRIKDLFCYSGGTEATALFPKVADTLAEQGFNIIKLSDSNNAIYAVKFANDEAPVICFSKKYNDEFNPLGNFTAIMTCNQADHDCPLVFGADARFPVPYEDPKKFDGTEQQEQKYLERSLEIAQEMWWVMSKV